MVFGEHRVGEGWRFFRSATRALRNEAMVVACGRTGPSLPGASYRVDTELLRA